VSVAKSRASPSGHSRSTRKRSRSSKTATVTHGWRSGDGWPQSSHTDMNAVQRRDETLILGTGSGAVRTRKNRSKLGSRRDRIGAPTEQLRITGVHPRHRDARRSTRTHAGMGRLLHSSVRRVCRARRLRARQHCAPEAAILGALSASAGRHESPPNVCRLSRCRGVVVKSAQDGKMAGVDGESPWRPGPPRDARLPMHLNHLEASHGRRRTRRPR